MIRVEKELRAGGDGQRQHGDRIAKHTLWQCNLTGIVDEEINTSGLKNIGVATTSVKG